MQSQAAALWPSPCSLVAGCAGSYAGAHLDLIGVAVRLIVVAASIRSGSPYDPLVATELGLKRHSTSIANGSLVANQSPFAVQPDGRRSILTRPIGRTITMDQVQPLYSGSKYHTMDPTIQWIEIPYNGSKYTARWSPNL